MSISTYLVLIIIVIIVNAVKSAQKKQQAEEARRMPTAKAQQPKQSVPQPTAPTPAPMPPEVPAHAHTTVHATQPKVHEHLAAECDRDAELQGSMAYDSPEGRDDCHADELLPVHENRPELPHEEEHSGLKLDFSPNAMVQAMVMQEVLTRPCERRRKR